MANVARSETAQAKKGETYHIGVYLSSERDKADMGLLDFIFDRVRQHGVSRRTVCRDALVLYQEQCEQDEDFIGPVTTAILAERQAAVDARAKAKAARGPSKRQVVRDAMVAALQKIQGVTRKLAAAVVEDGELGTWRKLAVVEVEDLVKLGLSKAAGSRVITEAANQAAKASPKKRKKKSKKSKPKQSESALETSTGRTGREKKQEADAKRKPGRKVPRRKAV